MDIFIAGVILIAAVAWDSSQEILDAVSLVSSETVAAIKPSASAETLASECAQGQPRVIARDLSVQASVENPAHDF